MGPIEKQLYRKVQLWTKAYLEEKENKAKRKKDVLEEQENKAKRKKDVLDQHGAHIFVLMLRLRQMAIHWSLVLKGLYTIVIMLESVVFNKEKSLIYYLHRVIQCDFYIRFGT